jgi:streptomycin 6-kinase
MNRVEERIRAWNITVEDRCETPSSVIVFGKRRTQSVVLKVVRQPGDEWHCGEVINAFEGAGMVRAYESAAGAMLLERLHPATSLAELALNGRDEEATEILADVMQRMSHPRTASPAFVTVERWGAAFARYLASGDQQLARELVEEARRVYAELCATQREVRLLHGDLQHYNVLLDEERGWTAIDPKGVVGEIEYEIGASLRNPFERPELFTAPATIERRLHCYAAGLKLEAERALRWSFAQAVLSAIWSVEDGCVVEAHTIHLARTLRAMFTV